MILLSFFTNNTGGNRNFQVTNAAKMMVNSKLNMLALSKLGFPTWRGHEYTHRPLIFLRESFIKVDFQLTQLNEIIR